MHRRSGGILNRAAAAPRMPGAKLETNDPLGVVLYGKGGASGGSAEAPQAERYRRARRHRAAARADAGHHRRAQRGRRATQCSRRPGSAGDGSDEDAARGHRARQRRRAGDHRRRRRYRVRSITRWRSSRSATMPVARASASGRSISIDPPRSGGGAGSPGTRVRCGAAEGGGTAARDRPAHRAGKHRGHLRSRHVRRIRFAGAGGAPAHRPDGRN